MTCKTLRSTGSLGTILKNRVAGIALRHKRISGILARVLCGVAREQAGAFPCCAPPCCMRNAPTSR